MSGSWLDTEDTVVKHTGVASVPLGLMHKLWGDEFKKKNQQLIK